MEMLVYVLTAFGAAWGIGHAHLSYPVRALIAGQFWGVNNKVRFARTRGLLVTLLECPGCFGFWEGVVAYALNLAPSGAFSHWWQAALFTASSNLLLYKLTGIADSAPPEGGNDERRDDGPLRGSPREGGEGPGAAP